MENDSLACIGFAILLCCFWRAFVGLCAVLLGRTKPGFGRGHRFRRLLQPRIAIIVTFRSNHFFDSAKTPFWDGDRDTTSCGPLHPDFFGFRATSAGRVMEETSGANSSFAKTHSV